MWICGRPSTRRSFSITLRDSYNIKEVKNDLILSQVQRYKYSVLLQVQILPIITGTQVHLSITQCCYRFMFIITVGDHDKLVVVQVFVSFSFECKDQ